MATRSQTGFVRDKFKALKEKKKQNGKEKKPLAPKKKATDAEKHRVSDQRIETKMPAIMGPGQPPPLEKVKPVAEVVVKTPVKKPVRKAVKHEPEQEEKDVVKKTKAKKPSRSKKWKI